MEKCLAFPTKKLIARPPPSGQIALPKSTPEEGKRREGVSHRCCKPKVNPFPFSSPQQVIPFCLPLQKRGGVRGEILLSSVLPTPVILRRVEGWNVLPRIKTNMKEEGKRGGLACIHKRRKRVRERRRIAHVWLTMTRKKRRGWMEVSSHRNIFPSFHCLMVLSLAWGWFPWAPFLCQVTPSHTETGVKRGRYYTLLYLFVGNTAP